MPDRQLSLAIGKEGQNARLAAKLTGWRIDIKPESAMQEQLAKIPAAAATTATSPGRAPAAAPAGREEAPQPWQEVIGDGERTEAPEREQVAAAQPAGAEGRRYASRRTSVSR